MNPAIFLQNNLVDRLTIPVAKFAHENGIELIDRSSTNDLDVNLLGINWQDYNPVLVFGSVQFLKKSQMCPHLDIQIQHSKDSFSARTWAIELKDRMLNASSIATSAAYVNRFLSRSELRVDPNDQSNWINIIPTPKHVRPLDDDKAFNANIFTLESWDEMRLKKNLSGDTECWISKVKEIKFEWRIWIVDRKAVEYSQYRCMDSMQIQHTIPDYILIFAKEICDIWLPQDCVVMDIALTQDGPKVIEFNPIHSSGWYASDVNKVLTPLMNYLKENYNG